MTLEERRAAIRDLDAEINLLQQERYKLSSECPHEIIVPPDYYEKLKTDQWHSDSAVCAGCGGRFGWFCPDSPDHICNYEQEDGRYNDDYCRYCGQPDERK